jgi:hypothetical protein
MLKGTPGVRQWLSSMRLRFAGAWHRAGHAFEGGGAVLKWLLSVTAVVALAFMLPGSWLEVDQTAPAADLSLRVRSAGTVLQLLGLATVVAGLMRSRGVFGRLPLAAAVAERLRRFKRIIFPKHHYLEAGNITLGMPQLSGAALVVTPPAKTLEERVARLEDRTDSLSTWLSEAEERRLEDVRILTQQIRGEANEREQLAQNVDERLELAVIGGIHLEIAGVGYLALGIVMTSLPLEVFSVFIC